MKSPSLRFHLIFLAAAVLLAAGVRIAFSFAEPTQTPPQGNVPAPLNVSSVGQTKTGNLVVNGLSVSGSGSVLTIPNGNVAIGKTIAGYALDVTGKIQATGDICTDLAGGKCLSAVAGAAGLWAANGTHISNTNSGNVGIGATNPGAKLEIGGNPNDAIRTAYLNISANNTSVTDRPYFRGVADHLVIAPRTTGNSTMYYSYPGDMVSGTTVDTRIQETLFIDRTGSGGGGNIGIKAGSTLYFGREESFGGTDTGGSDYGYIRWENDNDTYAFWGNSGENGALIIGSENDGQNQYSDVVVLKSSAGVMIDSGLGRFTGTAEAGYLVLRATDGTNEGGELRLDGAANDADPNHPSIHLDNFAGNARIHTLAAGKRFEVLGGDGIRVDALINCNTIDTDGSGNFSCGSDAAGTGGIAAESDTLETVTARGNLTTGREIHIRSSGWNPEQELVINPNQIWKVLPSPNSDKTLYLQHGLDDGAVQIGNGTGPKNNLIVKGDIDNRGNDTYSNRYYDDDTNFWIDSNVDSKMKHARFTGKIGFNACNSIDCGIWLWDYGDSGHVIYSANTAGAPGGLAGQWDTGHRFRFRTCGNSGAPCNQGFLFENNANQRLMDLDADDGRLWIAGHLEANDVWLRNANRWASSIPWSAISGIPAGFTDGVDDTGPTPPTGALYFGGMYNIYDNGIDRSCGTTSGGVTIKPLFGQENPATNACSCPAGFNNTIIVNVTLNSRTGSKNEVHYCWR